MTYCDCHSGVKKQLQNIEEHGKETHTSCEKAHGRIDGVEKSKVAYWVVVLLAGMFISVFGYQALKLEQLDDIGKGVAVLQTEVQMIKSTLKWGNP